MTRYDRDRIIENVDLLTLVSSYVQLRRIGQTSARGIEYAGPCPRCGTGDDRLRVMPDAHPPQWFCRVCYPEADRFGNVIDFGMHILGLDFRAACEWASNGTPPEQPNNGAPMKPRQYKPHEQLSPPSETWQARAHVFIDYAEAQLWSGAGEAALAYLRRRCLNDDTIRTARIGFNPAVVRDKPQAWNVPANESGVVYIPRGLVFPWFIDGQVWRVEMREGNGNKIGIKGYKQGLYNADAIVVNKPVVLAEGVIDALTAQQFAGDVLAAVATGAVTHARQTRWLARLALASLVLVAFDNEDVGDKASVWWLDKLPNARRWRPYWSDINQMAQDGADVRAWAVAGLDNLSFPSEPQPETPEPSPVEFAMQIVPPVSRLPQERCPKCKLFWYWQHPNGGWQCSSCHPAPARFKEADRCKITPDGPVRMVYAGEVDLNDWLTNPSDNYPDLTHRARVPWPPPDLPDIAGLTGQPADYAAWLVSRARYFWQFRRAPQSEWPLRYLAELRTLTNGGDISSKLWAEYVAGRRDVG